MRSKQYTAYTIVTTVLEGIAVAAVILWLLPKFGINVPLWGLILLIVAFLVYSYLTYHLGKKALERKPVVSAEAIIGSEGKAITALAPEGYVRVCGELWKASATIPAIGKDEEVVVVGIEGLTLFVAPLDSNHKCETSNQDRLEIKTPTSGSTNE